MSMLNSIASPPVPLISAVLCTWNRCELLDGALAALTSQEEAPPHEVIIVNNASTDATRDVVMRYAEAHPQVRYVEEPRAGVSYARNTGLEAARGALIAFTDDDIRVDRHWIRSLAAASEQYPDAGCIGGPVLPEPSGSPPPWLTRAHWAPLGIQDYDPKPFRVDANRPICMVGANLAVRRKVVDAIGPFDPAVQRIGNGIGSTEDHQYHLRLWEAGVHGVYDPRVIVNAVIAPERVSKRYHRAWHFGHGVHLSRMRLPELESSRWSVLGVPAHLIRQAADDFASMASALFRRDTVAAFAFEVRLWFVAGFVRQRIKTTLEARRSSRSREVAPGLRSS